jgi:hypothetical protein
MKKIITAALLLTAALLSEAPALDLDLTPHEIALANDGPPIRRYFFQDANKRLGFRMDDKMSASGATDSAVFRFSDIKTAAMKLSKSQMKPEVLFDEKNLVSYRAAARRFVPADAKDVRIAEEKADAIAINGWTSRQFVFTYSLFSIPYRRSITFLNYSEKEQIIFDIGAAATDYEKTYFRGYRVLNSLSELNSNSTSGPT